MLGFILPGLRDLRTTLVSGVMWVLGIYLIAGNEVIGSPEKVHLTPRAQQIVDFAGHGGILAAFTVVCVLVGQMTSGIVESLFFEITVRNMRRRIRLGVDLPEPRDLLGLFRPASRKSMRRLRDHVDELTELDETERKEVLALSLDEILYISPRLLAANPGLYSEFDRVRGEAEFRDGII
jgi:hypothetical protein